MHKHEAHDEHLARQLKDPGFAREWAIQSPLTNLELNVWSLRETKGISQQQLAETAQMKQPRIAEIERGGANPTLLTISRIAVALGVTADRLLAEPDAALLSQARAISEARYAASRPRRNRPPRPKQDSEPAQEPASPKRRATA